MVSIKAKCACHLFMKQKYGKRIMMNYYLVDAAQRLTTWAVVVAQLAERSLPISEDPGSNPVIGDFCWAFIYCLLVVETTKNKEKVVGNGPFLKSFNKKEWQLVPSESLVLNLTTIMCCLKCIVHLTDKNLCNVTLLIRVKYFLIVGMGYSNLVH